MNNLRAVLLYIALVFTSTISAQNFKHYNNSNELENNHIKGIQVDSLGYTWIGTENGLARYDGSLFKKYNLSELFNHPASENRVVTLFPPENGWVIGVIQSGKLFRALGNKVEVYSNYSPKKLHNSLDVKKNNFEILYYSYIYRHFVDKNRHHLMGVESGKITEEFPDGSKVAIPMPDGSNKKAMGLHALSFNYRYFYFLDHNHCYEWSQQSWKKTTIKGLPEPSKKNLEFTIISNFISEQRYMVLGKQLYKLIWNDKDNAWQAYLMVESIADDADITHVFHDAIRNILFVGTNNMGLYVYSEAPPSNAFKLIKTGTVRGFLEFGKNTLLNSQCDLLYTDNRKPLKAKQHELPFVNGYTRDHHGQIWINCTEKFFISENVFPLKLRPVKINSQYIYSALEDSFKRIWLLLDDKIAVHDNTLKGGLGKVIKSFNEIKNSAIFSLLNADELLIGSLNGYLYIFDQKTMHYETIVLDNKCRNIRSVRRLNHSVFMVTTYGNGVFLVSKNKSVSVPFELCESLSHAHAGYEYKPGRLIISTNNGIVEISISDLISFFYDNFNYPIFKVIDYDMNLPSLEFNGANHPCIQKLSDGTLAIAGVDGITLVDPEKLKIVHKNSNLLIESVYIDGEIYTGNLKYIKCRNFNPYIRIAYSIPFYEKKNSCIVEYKIVGKTDYRRLDYNSERILDLFELESGKHHLIFRHKTFSGKYFYKHMYIEAPKYWINKWKEIVVFLVVFIMILIGFFYLRNSYLAAQNKQLVAMVDDRTKRLSENLLLIDTKNRQLEKTLLFKNRIMSVISHDVLGPLRFAAKITKEISNKQTNAVDKETLNGIGQTIERMMVMSFDILTWAKSQSENFRALNIEINLFDVVERIFTLHEDNAKFKRQNMVNEIDDELSIHTDPNIISAVLNNLIENAVKYGGPGDIKVVCRLDKQSICIEVSNAGPQFETELADAINHADSQKIFEIASRKSKGGHGLRICYELLMMLNGHLYIHRVNEINVVGIKMPINGVSDSPQTRDGL